MCIVIFSKFLTVVTREGKSRATVANWPMKPTVMSTCMCLETIATWRTAYSYGAPEFTPVLVEFVLLDL